MSFLAGQWAETAPVADVYERVIVMCMAHRADADGSGCWESQATLAKKAMCDKQSIDKRIKALLRRGVLGLGDQNRNAHVPKNRRPPVYDLLIPYGWFSAPQMAQVNDERAKVGMPALRPEDRPNLQPARPSRKPRSDKGKPRPRKA